MRSIPAHLAAAEAARSRGQWCDRKTRKQGGNGIPPCSRGTGTFLKPILALESGVSKVAISLRRDEQKALVNTCTSRNSSTGQSAPRSVPLAEREDYLASPYRRPWVFNHAPGTFQCRLRRCNATPTSAIPNASERKHVMATHSLMAGTKPMVACTKLTAMANAAHKDAKRICRTAW